jgi:hypothetical protein
MIKTITFDELPKAVMELQQQQSALLDIAKAIFAKINEPQKPDNELVFGIFHRNERIRLSDSRLWSLPTSPFRSRKQVEHAKERNPNLFTRPASQRIWTVKADDLENWFTEWGKTDIPEL